MIVVDQKEPDLQKIDPANVPLGIIALDVFCDFHPLLLNADDTTLLFRASGQGEGINLSILDLLQQSIRFQLIDGCFDVPVILAVARRHAEELAHVLQLATIRQVVVCQDGNQRQNLELIILTA